MTVAQGETSGGPYWAQKEGSQACGAEHLPGPPEGGGTPILWRIRGSLGKVPSKAVGCQRNPKNLGKESPAWSS